ncbi:GNAT family N-acetyltransferase [Hoeflea prorocentri]|uniref:1-acyl-sn-glycerol-3-phosphate acyltransferase n=1 Tax=Hoeflea prorocentri TaxID=1922333 RepID=A0A9X3UM78_9HYPH|nr:1-acyl-sn-glycerol-3-phosphate acyltransferase [Hoeflea prorocentri]MCY6383425.1 1-acyl-sn-glycerol-3-phosphate acyltransferase [Hoeflea prorocentri]MDA5401225.1 1-acyl-sn-glycerol-3-phosphate acyltransferase [Hoeflea prorocentri]
MVQKRFHLTNLDDLADRLALVSYGQPGHVVDQLIAERGQKIVKNPLWPVMRPFLYSILHYRQAIDFADAIANMPGYDAMEYASGLLNLELQVNNEERIPASGGFILVCNHPTGIADGVAVFDLLKHRRPDMMIFANRDALRVNPRYAEIIIPVEWREEYKSNVKARETLKLTNRAVKEGKATILFPSGRIAYWANGRLNERPWKQSAVGLARRYGLPVLPVNMTARNSGLFYWLSKHSTELRDMTVFHEVLNKKRKTFQFNIGHLIAPDDLEGDVAEITRSLEHHCVFELADNPDCRFHHRTPAAA